MQIPSTHHPIKFTWWVPSPLPSPKRLRAGRPLRRGGSERDYLGLGFLIAGICWLRGGS